MSRASSGAQPPSPAPPRPLHAQTFKLRFAPQRELGRSYVSLVKPFGMPATVADKFYARSEAVGGTRGERQERQEREEGEETTTRIQETVARGPRDKHAAPVTSAHEYGWWWDRITSQEQVPRSDLRLHYHIQDSQWLKECMRVLATDDKLKHK